MLKDPGGEPLDRLIGPPMEIGKFLRLAVALAVALGRLHGRRLIHKDIKPVTVKIYRGHIMKKMGASLADLVRMAETLGVRRTKS